MIAPPSTKEVRHIVGMLEDSSYADAESMAASILEAAYEMFCANRMKYVVVGQLVEAPSCVPRSELIETKVALGPYSTPSKARAAGRSLAYSSSTAETYRWVVLPVHQGTPAEYHTARKKARGDDESEGRLPWVEEWEKARAA